MTTNSPGRWRPTTRPARAATAVGAALFLATLTGCTGGSTPIVTETPSPTATASTSPSPSPSPTPLTDAELLELMPPDAAYPDVRGAIATAEFFTAQFAVMFQTGDSRVIAALSSPECTFCAEVLADAAKERSAGELETGGDVAYDATQVRANLHTGDGFTYVDFPYTQSAVTLHHADGSLEETDPGSAGRVYYRMGLVEGVWHVIGAEVRSD